MTQILFWSIFKNKLQNKFLILKNNDKVDFPIDNLFGELTGWCKEDQNQRNLLQW